MGNVYFCGIDISKNSFSVCIINSSLELLFKKDFKMDSDGFISFIEIVKEKYNNCKFALESTSLYHIPLSVYLINHSFDLFLLNASLVKKFSDFITLRKTKTDTLDSKIISLFLAKNFESLHNYKLNNFNELSGFARIRENLIFEISQIKTMIKQYLYPVFPEADKTFDIFSKTLVSILIKYPSAKAISSVDLDDLRNCLPKEKGRKISLDKIYTLAKNSVGIESNIYESFTKILIEKYIFLEKQLAEVTDNFIKMVEAKNKQELEILKSIDGISDITAATFLAEINGKNFSNSKKLRAYAGTDPTIKQSGKMLINGKISKRGNSHLRRVFWIMATYVIMWNNNFNDYFRKKREEGFSYKKAQMAVVNKLIRLIFTLLEKKTMYEPNYVYI